MRQGLVICGRELASLFLSPTAYIAFILNSSLSMWTFLQALARREGSHDAPMLLLVMSVLFWLPILATIATMRLFAEEKRSGGLEALLTLPVTEAAVVLGKYAGALIFCLVVTLPSLGGMVLVDLALPEVALIDAGSFASGCLILCLLTAMFTSVGLVASLLSPNLIVAAVTCFVAMLVPILFEAATPLMPGLPPRFVEYVSLTRHVTDFSSGLIAPEVIVLYLSVTIFMLFAGIRLLESRRWVA